MKIILTLLVVLCARCVAAEHPNVRALRTDQWKYIHYPPGDGTPDKHLAELYDLAADPAESRNLAIGYNLYREIALTGTPTP